MIKNKPGGGVEVDVETETKIENDLNQMLQIIIIMFIIVKGNFNLCIFENKML